MFKNAIIFRINDDWEAPPVAALQEALEMAKFVPCGATQRESYGWVEPRGEQNAPFVESVGGELIFKMMGESKMLPSSVVKERLEERCKKVEADTGRKPGSKAKKELKEQIELELLPQAFTKKGATLMWVSPKGKFIVIDAGSIKKADRLTHQFIEALGQIGNSITLRPVNTKTSPATAMSLWLTEMEAPAGFSVDRDCELKAPDGEKATVRYARHTLDIEEVVEHIKVQGKIPTKLAMTHGGRVSFVLADDLSLKKVEVLDVVLESTKKEDSGFDADVAIVTGEMRKLIPDLIEALGGESLLGDAAAGEDAVGADEKPESQVSDAAHEPDAAPWESGGEMDHAEANATATEVV
jgi:recombination associated protein RdgC